MSNHKNPSFKEIKQEAFIEDASSKMALKTFIALIGMI